jgi:hypothetical protein
MLNWQMIKGKESANELWNVSAEGPVAEVTLSHIAMRRALKRQELIEEDRESVS